MELKINTVNPYLLQPDTGRINGAAQTNKDNSVEDGKRGAWGDPTQKGNGQKMEMPRAENARFFLTVDQKRRKEQTVSELPCPKGDIPGTRV